MDDVIYEEFKGTGNMELHLDRRMAERRIYPAIDVRRSGTRREEALLTKEELEKVCVLRRGMNDTPDFLEGFLKKIRDTETHEECIAGIETSGNAKSNRNMKTPAS